jgi:adenosylhomocysteine nucleosidase
VTASCRTTVLISADAEWRAITSLLHKGQQPGLIEGAASPIKPSDLGQTPFGNWLITTVGNEEVLFMHGGWGKIAAAASTQYAIDCWKPELLVNLGTCGGFDGEVERGEILLVTRTVVYDIVEQMGDYSTALAHYTTELDLSWVGANIPAGVRRSPLVSADRDLLPGDIGRLKASFGAVAADWESGAIAWVAAHNRIPCLILRGVTDLVTPGGGEAYGDYALFTSRTEVIMRQLLETLPLWLDLFFH